MSFIGVEVWTDVGCASPAPTLRAWVPLGQLVACAAQWSVDGQQDQLTVAVSLGHYSAAELTRGRVVRVRTDDPAVYDEWRIEDTEDTSDGRIRAARCTSIAQDLSRALYVGYTSTGEADARFSAVGVTSTEVLNGPVRDALDAAGLPWLVTGTVNSTDEIDLSVEYATARSLIASVQEATGAELEVVRNGTTDYAVNLVETIGASADPVYVRTARNLRQGTRRLIASEGGTRVVPRGRDDQTSRTVGRAYWEVTNVSGSTLTLRDPRGAGFPEPCPFASMLVGQYVVKRAPVPSYAVISAVTPSGSETSAVTVTGTPPFSTGDEVYFADIVPRTVTRVASSTANTSTITTPDALVGDLVVIAAWRSGSNTPPSTPTGYTLVTGSGANNVALAVFYRRQTVNGTTNVTSTNAGNMISVVYRGARDAAQAVQSGGNSDEIAVSSWSQTGLANSANGLVIVGHQTATDIGTLAFSGTGYTPIAVTNVAPGIAAYDAGDGLSGDSGDLAELVDASGAWRTANIEVRANLDIRPLWGLTSPALLAAQAGIYDRVLDRPTLSGSVPFVPNPYLRDQTGTTTFTVVNGAATASTSSPTVTFTTSIVDRSLQAGDVLRRASDNAILGTVASAGNLTATLTANSLLTISGVTCSVTRAVPSGFTASGQFTSSFVPQGLFPDVPLGFGFQFYSGNATGLNYLYTPVIPVPIDTETPYRLWWWVSLDDVAGTGVARFQIVDASNLATLVGVEVSLDDDLEGSLVRVLFESPTLLDHPNGVRIRMQCSANERVTVGPYGAAPASWTPADVEVPRACDLWHEGTLWLRTQSIPEGYDLDLVDLHSVDATAYPWERLVLGGELVVDDVDLGVQSTQRVVALTRDYLAPGSGQVTLGRRERGLAEYLAAQQNVSVADIALRLSRGLVRQVEILRAAPSVVATSTAITTIDPTPIAVTAGAIQSAFTEGN